MTGSQLARFCSNRTADGTLAGPWKPTLWLESGQESQFFFFCCCYHILYGRRRENGRNPVTKHHIQPECGE